MLVTWILPDPGYYSIRRDISKFSCVITMMASHVSHMVSAADGNLGVTCYNILHLVIYDDD